MTIPLPPEVEAAIEERAVMLSTLHFGPLHLLRAGIERTAAESHHAALVNNMREVADLAYAAGLAAGAQGEREALAAEGMRRVLTGRASLGDFVEWVNERVSPAAPSDAPAGRER